MLEGEVGTLAAKRESLRGNVDHLAPDFPNVFFRVDIVPEVYRGIVTISQSYGIGNLEANTVMLGWLKKRERAKAYFRMLNELTVLDNSLVLVDHDPFRSFGRHGRIHVWWGGLKGNGGLMLLLAYLIRSSDRWQGAQVTALTVIDDPADHAQATARLRGLFESARLDAEARVILRDGRSITDIMASESKETDLTMLGLRLPETAEHAEGLYDHYSTLLSNLPSTILVHSAGTANLVSVLFDDDVADDSEVAPNGHAEPDPVTETGPSMTVGERDDVVAVEADGVVIDDVGEDAEAAPEEGSDPVESPPAQEDADASPRGPSEVSAGPPSSSPTVKDSSEPEAEDTASKTVEPTASASASEDQ